MFKKVSIPPEHGRDIRPIHRTGTRDVRRLELTEFNNTWPDGATMMPSPPSRILHPTTWVVSATTDSRKRRRDQFKKMG